MKAKTLGSIVLSAEAIGYSMGLIKNQTELTHDLEPLRQEILLEINNKVTEKGDEARFDFDYNGKIEAINNAVHKFYTDNNMHPIRGGWGTTTKTYDKTQVPVAPIPLQINPSKWHNQKTGKWFDKDASAVKTYFQHKYGQNYQKHMHYK